MNDLARGFLVAAALDGTKQIRGTLFWEDGRCAMGVIIEGLGLVEDWKKTRYDFAMSLQLGSYVKFWDSVYEQAEMNADEHAEVIKMNDREGLDFLSIARKLGNKEEQE